MLFAANISILDIHTYLGVYQMFSVSALEAQKSQIGKSQYFEWALILEIFGAISARCITCISERKLYGSIEQSECKVIIDWIM